MIAATSVLVPADLPELLFSIAIIGCALAVILVVLACVVPPLYAEAKTWLPARRRADRAVDLDRRRRQLSAIAAPGYPHRRVQ